MKKVHLLKPPLEHMPKVPTVAGNVREEKMPIQPTPGRAVLASSRKIMQAIRAIRRLVTKYAWCIYPGTIQRSVKYSRNIPRSKLYGSHTKTKKPTVEATKIVVRSLSSTERHKR